MANEEREPGEGEAYDLSEWMRSRLRQLNSRISILEAVLGNLHRTEAKTGVRQEADKADLKRKLTACYVLRETLKRGHVREDLTLNESLKRIEVRLDHRHFRRMGRIERTEVEACDLDALARRLQG
jgi:hypothetical protein